MRRRGIRLAPWLLTSLITVPALAGTPDDLAFDEAMAAILTGDTARARALCDPLTRARPDWWGGPLCLGLAAAQDGDAETGIPLLERATDAYESSDTPAPQPQHAYVMLAVLQYETTGDPAIALATLERGVRTYERSTVLSPADTGVAAALANLRATRVPWPGFVEATRRAAPAP